MWNLSLTRQNFSVFLPAAALRGQLIYGSFALVLSKAALHHHYKVRLERLQKLHQATPEPVVYFLGGSLPLTALLHLCQLSPGTIARLGPKHVL